MLSVGGSTVNLTVSSTAGTNSATTPLIYASAGVLNIINSTLKGTTSANAGVALSVIPGGSCLVTLRNCTLYPGAWERGGPAVDGGAATGQASKLRISGDVWAGGLVAGTGNAGFIPIVGCWMPDAGGNGLRLHLLNDSAYPGSMTGAQTILSVYGSDLPAVSDVRLGTAYGPSDTLVGTCAVPPALSVIEGVPVDDGVGTGGITLAAIAAMTGAQLAAAAAL